jgi:predicted DCC family thiol-disulfide oxidoreductase YuxK
LSGALQSVLLYDEDCGFCRWSLDKILAWDRAKRVRPVPIQSEEGSRLLAPIPPDARLDSWHLARADGRLFSAGAAAEPLARLLPGGRPLAAVFAAFPGTTERAYGFAARHRDRLARLLRVDANCRVRRRA